MLLLVGAGIGVTPFASVLADMVNRLESRACQECGAVAPHISGDGSGLAVGKIYFRESRCRPRTLRQTVCGLSLLCSPTGVQAADAVVQRTSVRLWCSNSTSGVLLCR